MYNRSIVLSLLFASQAHAVTFSGTTTVLCQDQDEFPSGITISETHDVPWSLTWNPLATPETLEYVDDFRYGPNGEFYQVGWVLDMQGPGLVTATLGGVTYSGSGQAFFNDGMLLADGTYWEDFVNLATGADDLSFGFGVQQRGGGSLVSGLDASGGYDYRPDDATSTFISGGFLTPDGLWCYILSHEALIETDGDGFCHAADTDDLDGNGYPDDCEIDGDSDGVPDDVDACANTASGAVVDAAGCSIAQICPCDDAWKNKGAYQSCVAKASDAFVGWSLLTDDEADDVVASAAASTCGAL